MTVTKEQMLMNSISIAAVDKVASLPEEAMFRQLDCLQG